jgi:dolichol-phosphate mannosyltransferase
MSKIRASVILPTYNESGNIVKLVEEVRKELAKERINNEVIIVDDDSPDNTGLLAQKYFSNDPAVRVVIRKNEKGLATAIRRGLEVAVGEIVVVMDTDFNHPPKLVPKLIKKCGKYDLVIGSRFVKGGGMSNKLREFLSRLFNLLVILIIQSPAKDNLSGLFAMKYYELSRLNYDRIFLGYGDYFIRLIYLANKQGNIISEIPVYYNEREYGESKTQFLKIFKDYLAATLAVRFKNDLNDYSEQKI